MLSGSVRCVENARALNRSLNIAFQTSASNVFCSPGINFQVFARGSGPECRKAVQELNLKRMEVGRLEEQKLEAAIIMEEENRELERFAEYMEDEKQHVMKVEGKLEGAGRSPLAPIQAAASGSRWEKFLPSSTSNWEEEGDDLEAVQGGDFCSENRPVPSRGEDAYDAVPSKKSKVPFGKRKANDVHIDNTTGNVSSKWGKFSS